MIRGVPRGLAIVRFDAPFPISVPTPCLLTYDPEEEVAGVCFFLLEGSVSFSRSTAIEGPNMSHELRARVGDRFPQYEPQRYMLTGVLHDGRELASLNILTGSDGGFHEAKFYCQVDICLVVGDTQAILDNGVQAGKVVARAIDVFNLFLDKYLLFSGDVRAQSVAMEKGLYVAQIVVSGPVPEDATRSNRQMLESLSTGRVFSGKPGLGPVNHLRLNSWDALGPKPPLPDDRWHMLETVATRPVEMPVFYRLLFNAIRELVIHNDFRLAILEGETAFEVYIRQLLAKLLVDEGRSQSDASALINDDDSYWGITRKLTRLDGALGRYAARQGTPPIAFEATNQKRRWKADLYELRNRIIHEGDLRIAFGQAHDGLRACWDSIYFLEGAVPTLREWIVLEPFMERFGQTAGTLFA